MKNNKRRLIIPSLIGMLLFPITSFSLDETDILPSDVLSLSTETYVKSQVKHLSDYTYKGVHANGNRSDRCVDNLIKVSNGPNIEVITDYNVSAGGYGKFTECSGTALIPKGK